MKKKIVCIALSLLLVLSVSACSSNGEKEPTVPPESSAPTEPSTQATEPPETTESETKPTEDEQLWAKPWRDDVELIYIKEEGSPEQYETDMDLGGQFFRYTGDSNVIDMPEFGFTITLPEEWMERVDVIFTRSGRHNDGADSVHSVTIINKALAGVYATMIPSPIYKPNVLYGFHDNILSVTWYAEPQEYCQMEIENGYALGSLTGDGKYYYLYTVATEWPEGDHKLMRYFLQETIGQEAYDALVGDLVCSEEEAYEIFKLR